MYFAQIDLELFKQTIDGSLVLLLDLLNLLLVSLLHLEALLLQLQVSFAFLPKLAFE